MPPASQAVATPPAHHVPLPADDLARMKVLDVRPHLNHPADEFVPHDQRHRHGLLRPGVPIVNMQVRPADPRAQNLDQHVVDPYRRHRHILQPKPLLRLPLHQRLHRLHPCCLPVRNQSGVPAANACPLCWTTSMLSWIGRKYNRSEAISKILDCRLNVPPEKGGVVGDLLHIPECGEETPSRGRPRHSVPPRAALECSRRFPGSSFSNHPPQRGTPQ